jgi:hypothetical protein
LETHPSQNKDRLADLLALVKTVFAAISSMAQAGLEKIPRK